MSIYRIFFKNIPSLSTAVTSVTKVLKKVILNFCGKKCMNIRSNFKSDKFASRFVCIDATTGEFHTENDGTWTVISVPNQNISGHNKVYFNFKLNNNVMLKLRMREKSSLLYTAKLMTHRQS